MSHFSNLICRFLFESLFQGAIVLSIASAATWMLRRRSSAERCLIWQTATLLLILLPVVSAFTGGTAMPFVPRSVAQLFAEEPTGPARATLIPESSRLQVPGVGPTSPADDGEPFGHEVASEAPALGTPAHVSPTTRNPACAAVALWIAVSLCLLLETLAGQIRLKKLQSSCSTRPPATLRALLLDVCELLKIRRKPLLLAKQGVVPMAWGWRSPKVLLPQEAEGWPLRSTEMVLLHELAHLRRGDWLLQRMAKLICCLLWFHPAAWICFRKMKESAEEACDDVVLVSGVEGPEYAAQLLEVVRLMRQLAATGASGRYTSVAMANTSHIRGRVSTILEPTRNRKGLSRNSFLTTGLLTIALLPLGLLHVFAQSKPGPVLSPEVKKSSAQHTISKKTKKYSRYSNHAKLSLELSARLKQQAIALKDLNREIQKSIASSQMTASAKADAAAKQQRIQNRLRSIQGSIQANSRAEAESAKGAALASADLHRAIEMANVAASRAAADAMKQTMMTQQEAQKAVLMALKAAKIAQINKENGTLGLREQDRLAMELALKKQILESVKKQVESASTQYNQGLASADAVEKAIAELQEAQTEVKKAQIDSGDSQVQDREYQKAAAELQLAQSQLEQARKQLETAETRYKAGIAAKSEVDNAQVAVDKSKLQLFEAREMAAKLKEKASREKAAADATEKK